jgi:Fur family peroxide stress response transcriptional regulator
VKKEETQTRFEELARKLRERDCRLTPQRLALLRILATSTSHPSAAQLYAQLKDDYPTMSPGTVYKTLALLKEMGEVLELGFSNDDNRYDGRLPVPHAHIVCTSCHKIVDANESLNPDFIRQATRRSDFSITGHRLDFYGLCPDCQRKQLAA